MSTEIVQWAVIRNGAVEAVFNRECEAIIDMERYGGTVVKLTGTMPRELRKISAEVWIAPCEPKPQGENLCDLLGFQVLGWCKRKTAECNVKARITLEELEVTDEI